MSGSTLPDGGSTHKYEALSQLDLDASCHGRVVQALQTSMIPGPNFSTFSCPRPWTAFSCVSVCGRARTMLRRVVEARTKKRGRLSFSDWVLRYSRRRWSRACCSGVRSSVGSGVAERVRVKVLAVGGITTPGNDAFGVVLAECGGLSISPRLRSGFGRDDASWVRGMLRGASKRQMAMMSAP